MSRTITFAKAGDPEVLDYVEAEAVNPGADEVRIKVKAIGLNRADDLIAIIPRRRSWSCSG